MKSDLTQSAVRKTERRRSSGLVLNRGEEAANQYSKSTATGEETSSYHDFLKTHDNSNLYMLRVYNTGYNYSLLREIVLGNCGQAFKDLFTMLPCLLIIFLTIIRIFPMIAEYLKVKKIAIEIESRIRYDPPKYFPESNRISELQ